MEAESIRTMHINQQALTILGTALTTSSSFNVLIITFLLGEYASLDRNGRPSREKEPYFYSVLLLFGVLWLGGTALLLLFLSVFFYSKCLFFLVSSLFSVQLFGLVLGLSWVGYKTLFEE